MQAARRLLLLLTLPVCVLPAATGRPITQAADPPAAQLIVAPIYSDDNPGSNNHFFVRLLRLALDKTVASHGPYELREPPTYLFDNRLRAAMASGRVDIAWFTRFAEAEKRFLMVDDPLLGRINEYRLLLIRRQDRDTFRQVEQLHELREFTAGIGSQWADRYVFDANRLPYVTGPRYAILFRMLKAGRFDYFPRGLYQIKNELGQYPEQDFVIADNIMLHYPHGIRFFVPRERRALARRVELGLARAREDGSFDALFNSFEQFRWAEAQLRDNRRRIFYLHGADGKEATSLSPSEVVR